MKKVKIKNDTNLIEIDLVSKSVVLFRICSTDTIISNKTKDDNGGVLNGNSNI
jgi:hypothetical protein